ncbi:MAG: ATP-binding protein [Polaromonas sp.]
MRRWVWLHLVWCVFASAALGQPSSPQPSLPIALNQAQLSVTLAASDQSTDKKLDLGQQALPWRWDHNFLRQRGVMHFTFNVPLSPALVTQLQADGKGLGLSSLHMGSRYRYRINGRAWQNVGWMQANEQFRVRPRWQLLAANDLQAGNNLLELDIRAEPASNAGLASITLGDETASLAAHESESNKRRGLALVSGTLSALISFLSMAIWWKSREKSFLIVSLAQTCFALWQIDFFIDYPPVPTWVFNATRSALYVYFAGLMCWVSVLLVKQPALWLDRMIRLYLWTALPAVVAGAALGDYRVFELFWTPASVLLVAASAARFTYVTWRKSDGTVRINGLLTAIMVSFGLYDFILTLLPSGFGKQHLVYYMFFLSNFAVGMMLVRRYWGMQNRILKLRYEKDLEVAQAALIERQRMMQDIHDSVGSQLVALLGLVNSDAPRTQIQAHTSDALDELRMAVDAIDKVDGDLAVVLATMRHRLQPRLDAAHLHLRWQVDTLPKFEKLTPKDIQHIQRILLEVFSNIIQHAKAKEVVLSARYHADANVCQICISDDGIGVNAGATSGRGLSNMQSRAEMLGATLSVTPNQPIGTLVRLDIAVH